MTHYQHDTRKTKNLLSKYNEYNNNKLLRLYCYSTTHGKVKRIRVSIYILITAKQQPIHDSYYIFTVFGLFCQIF